MSGVTETICRSLNRFKVVEFVAVLFNGLISFTEIEEAAGTIVSVALADPGSSCGVTVNVTVMVWGVTILPAARLPILQTTVSPVAGAGVVALPVAGWQTCATGNVPLAVVICVNNAGPLAPGNGMVSTTFVASDGPAFPTTIW